MFLDYPEAVIVPPLLSTCAEPTPELDIEYFFTDTGKELPEVYEYLGRLEGFLGKPILRLNPDRDFDFWLKQYNDFLPSPQTRWCTRQLKLRPLRTVDPAHVGNGGYRLQLRCDPEAMNSTGRGILPSMKTWLSDFPLKI